MPLCPKTYAGDLTSPSIEYKAIYIPVEFFAAFENDIRRERQMNGIMKARERGVRFGRKPVLVAETIKKVRKLRRAIAESW